MRPRTQKQPQVKKELCRALDDVDVDVDHIVSSVGCILACQRELTEDDIRSRTASTPTKTKWQTT